MSTAKVLIVEDEVIVAKDISLRLKELGYTPCDIASSGEEAIEKALFHKPDIILMDIMLKGKMNGIEASEKIKESLQIPIIFITAYTNNPILKLAKINEPYAYIVKPFDERELHINIEIALYKYKTEKRLKQSEERLYKTLVNIGDAIITTDTKGNITFLNPTAEKLLSSDSNNLISNSIYDLISIYKEENEEIIIDYLDDSINLNNINTYDDCVLKTKNSNEIIVNIKTAPIRDYNNNVIGAAVIISDITEKRQISDITNFISETVLMSVGDEFFKILVKQISKILKIKFVFIAENADLPGKVLNVLAYWRINRFGFNKILNVADSPGDRVFSGDSVFINKDLKNIYPNIPFFKKHNLESYIGLPLFDSQKRIIGQIGILTDKPIKENNFYKTILEFVCSRSSLEIQRKRNEEKLLRSEEKYKDLTNSLPHTIFETDHDGKITFFNKFGFDRFDINQKIIDKGYYIYNIILEKDKIKDNLNKIFNGETIGFSEYTAIKDNNEQFPVLMYYNPVISQNKSVSSLRGVIIDISELSKTKQALKETEEKYNITIKGINDGFWDWNINSDKVHYSLRWKNMLGYEDNEIGESIDDWFNRVHHEDINILRDHIYNFLNGSTSKIEYEYRILNKSGQFLWVFCNGNSIADDKNKVYRLVGTQTDITQHKQNEKLLETLLHNASHDSLTGLPNRPLFLEKLEKSILNSKRKPNKTFAVLFINIDRFKVVNDSLGHSIGNLLLSEAAIKLQLCLRPEDTIARLGSDEFTIILEDIHDSSDAINVANRIQKDLSYPFILNNQEIFASASIGIAMGSNNYDNPEELLRDADIAMRKAKTFGRARFELFDTGMKTQAKELLQLEADLRYAIDRKEFMLYYQPIISLKTGYITGFEALIRWNHPKRGIVGSDVFIPIAEETGMIIQIGKWVLKEACRQIKIWQNKFKTDKPLTVSVNISGRQFSHPKLIKHISKIVKGSEIDPSTLKLEITESTIMDNAETARTMLEEIRDLNIQLQIDDFGTGYSSLSYLHRFPVNSLKVDRSFVGRIGSDDENLEIVKTIVSLAKNLNMNAIAEGIETESQLTKLRGLNCEYGQGYYFSRPVDVKSIEALMDTNPVW